MAFLISNIIFLSVFLEILVVVRTVCGIDLGIVNMKIRSCLSALHKCHHSTCTVSCDTTETVEDITKYRSLFQSAFALAQSLCMTHLQYITKSCDHSSERCYSLCHFFIVFHESIAGYIDILTNCLHNNIQLIPGFL